MIRQIRALCSRAIVQRLAINISHPRSGSRRDRSGERRCRARLQSGRDGARTKDLTGKVVLTSRTIRSRYTRRTLTKRSRLGSEAPILAGEAVPAVQRVVSYPMRCDFLVKSFRAIVSSRNRRTLFPDNISAFAFSLKYSYVTSLFRNVYISSCIFYVSTFMLKHTMYFSRTK